MFCIACAAGDEACLVGPLLQQPALVAPLLEAVLRSLAHPRQQQEQQQQQQAAAQPSHWPEAAAAYRPDPMTWQFSGKLLGVMQALADSHQQQQQLAAAFSKLVAE